MIVGLLIVGSVIGGSAGLATLAAGLGLWNAVLVYAGTGSFSILVIAIGCAYRPRHNTLNTPNATTPHSIGKPMVDVQAPGDEVAQHTA